MPAVKYSHSYVDIHEQELPKKSNRVTSPIKKSRPVQKSKTSVKQKVDKLNFVLVSASCLFAIAFTAVYSIVAISETKLSNLHSQISEMNYENIELENKLENVKSYYSVDTKVASSADFSKAKHVLEVNHVNAKIIAHNKPKSNHLNTVTGF